jgi:hypothetical protein
MSQDKDQWKARYVARMVACGVDAEGAVACFEAGSDDHDYDSNPEEAADDEMSYWENDGG